MLLVTRWQLSEGSLHDPKSSLVSSGSGCSVTRATPPSPHRVSRQQVAGAAPERAKGGGLSLSASAAPRSLTAPSLPPPPLRPARAPADQHLAAPAAPPTGLCPHLQPVPRAQPAVAAAASLAPSTAEAPGPSSECAWVSDPSTHTPEPANSRVLLLHLASQKMNVRRVESISAQLEEASSTGGRMQ